MANYTDATNISEYLQRALTPSETSALNTYILNAVDKWINRTLGSQFDNAAPSTRYFDGGGRTIDLDPCQAITAVTAYNNDGSASYSYTSGDEYVAEPANETIKRELVLRGRNLYFPHGNRRIAVTATFTEYEGGVPGDIVLAATRIAAGIINAGKYSGQGENLQEESLEGHMVRYNITNNSIDTLMATDPILSNILGARREIYIYDEGDNHPSSELDW